MKIRMTRLIYVGPLKLEVEVSFDFHYSPGRAQTRWEPEDPPEGWLNYETVKRLDGLQMHAGVYKAIEDQLEWNEEAFNGLMMEAEEEVPEYDPTDM